MISGGAVWRKSTYLAQRELQIALATEVADADLLEGGRVGRRFGSGLAATLLIADGLHQVERRVLGEVVEEDAADAARLVAVAEEEVFVAPPLVFPVHMGAEGRERLPAGRNTITVRVATTLNNRLARIDDDVANRGLVQPYGLVGPVRLMPYRTATVWSKAAR